MPPEPAQPPQPAQPAQPAQSTDGGVVVGMALRHRGRVLAARRTAPPELAGRWELPGGKVEPGETAEVALVREVSEELGCEVAVETWLDGEVPVGRGLVLRVAVTRLVRGRPEPREHDEVRWLTVDDLDSVDWLEPDRPFLGQLAGILDA